MSRLKKTKYLGKREETSSSPDKFELDSVPNPHPKNNYVVRLTAPEFTSICPVTGQPDFGIIIVLNKNLQLINISFPEIGDNQFMKA